MVITWLVGEYPIRKTPQGKKRSNISGSVARLSAKDYKDQPIINASLPLQGRVADVSVSNYSGAPGGVVKIRIRGANSITGNNEPLYLVDGLALTGVGLSGRRVCKYMYKRSCRKSQYRY